MLPAPTARLRFREMTPGDLDAMEGLLADPRVMTYYPAPKTRAEVEGWIGWNVRNYATDGFGLWIIETHDGSFVGDCGLTWQDVDGVRMLEVGYHVMADLQGRGFATEAAAACRELARERGIARQLIALIDPANGASRAVAERIGLEPGARDGRGRLVFRAAMG